MVSGFAPGNDVGAQWDLIEVDAQIDGENLIFRGTLTRLESSWMLTGFAVFIDTDSNSTNGEPISNILYPGEIIGADYEVKV